MRGICVISVVSGWEWCVACGAWTVLYIVRCFLCAALAPVALSMRSAYCILGVAVLSLALVSSDVLGAPAEAVGNFSFALPDACRGVPARGQNVCTMVGLEGKNTGPR